MAAVVIHQESMRLKVLVSGTFYGTLALKALEGSDPCFYLTQSGSETNYKICADTVQAQRAIDALTLPSCMVRVSGQLKEGPDGTYIQAHLIKILPT